MPPTLPPLARDLLHTLLDRYETPQRQTVVRVTLSTEKHAAYFEQFEVRDTVNAALRALAEQGVLTLHPVKHHPHLLDKIDLNSARAADLYTLLNRRPRAEAVASLRALLTAQTPVTDWQARFLQHSLAQLAAHKSVAPLRLDDDHHNHTLLAGLAAVGQLTEPVLERVFSVQVFGDSKQFETLRHDFLRLLRKFDPGAEVFADDDQALLAAHWLERVPEYIPLAGQLTLRLQGERCECAPFIPNLALPASLLRAATIDQCPATTLLTIENMTSFLEFCRVRPPSVLALFTGGFASPTVIQFLNRLQAYAPHLRLIHWGDLDGGGLRILRHLRQHLGTIQPIGMDVSTFSKYQAYAQPLKATDVAALQLLLTDPSLADCQALISTLLAKQCKLEQEAIPIAQLLELLI